MGLGDLATSLGGKSVDFFGGLGGKAGKAAEKGAFWKW